MKVEILWGVCWRVEAGDDGGWSEGRWPREADAGCCCCCWLKKGGKEMKEEERKGTHTHI